MNFINVVLTVVGIVIVGLILRLPQAITDKWLEQTKNKNAHSIQIESYFKSVSVSKQENILSKWTDFLTDMEATTAKYTSKSKEAEWELRSLLHDTVVYGSDQTVKLLSIYMKNVFHSFENQESEEKQQKDDDTNMAGQIVYYAFIIASLKADFTGYEIDPLTLLEMQISDYDKYEIVYKQCADNIKKQLRA